MSAPALPARAQCLADGVPGIALLHIERARHGRAGWGPVHTLAREMTRIPVQASPATASLFYGAPAVAYALHAAGQPAYRTALATLDRSIDTLIRLRLQAAHRRIDHGVIARAREYDLIGGLTGLGAYLLHRYDEHPLLRDALSYLVRLTRPVQACGQTVPGWWAAGSPDRHQLPRWDEGHAGFGMAHGISGPLALLSITMRRGVTVNGHHEAIHAISTWLSRWTTSDGSCAWWPEVISRDELQAGICSRPGPNRPSWCYGTPGIARALHLAGLALGDQAQAHRAIETLLGCLTDRRQLAYLTDHGLCHGRAGLIHTARRTYDDCSAGELAAAASRLQYRQTERPIPADDGLLQGKTGVALAGDLHAGGPPGVAQWDNCLLVG